MFTNLELKKLLEYGWLLKGGQILIAIVVAFIVFYIGKSVIHKMFNLKFRIKRHTKELKNRKETLEKIVLSLFRYFIYIVLFLTILNILGFDIAGIAAGVGVTGLIFAVGSQKLIQDFVEGFFHLMEGNIDVNDTVTINNITGTVVDVGLRSITLKTPEGVVYVIPNSLAKSITNYSFENNKVIVQLRLAKETPLNKTITLLSNHLTSIQRANTSILGKIEIAGMIPTTTKDFDVRFVCEVKEGKCLEVEEQLRTSLISFCEENEIQLI